MGQSKKITLTIDENKLMNLFAGGNYGGNRPATCFALNALDHARATISVLQSHRHMEEDQECDQKARNLLLYYTECQLDFAADVVRALEAKETRLVARESEAAE